MNLSTLSYFTQFGRVFPLADNSKTPRRGWRWRQKNSNDLVILAEWLNKYPDANWALIPDRTFVVDLDCKNGKNGRESIETAGGLDLTFTVRTPSGGSHHYFAPNPRIPFQTRNGWLEGVDIRYGDGGYLVLPYSRTDQGRYELEVDVDELPNCASHPSESGLTPIPEWIRATLEREPPALTVIPPNTPACVVSECDNEWEEIRDRIRYMFFRNRKNVQIWNHQPLPTMIDRSQSSYEWQLAIRMLNVGATDQETVIAYRVWCRKHNLRIKNRFHRVLADARVKTAQYVAEWQAKQPVRRKHGTTTNLVLDAIKSGAQRPRAIIEQTGLKGSAVRMQLKRLTEAGKLRRTPSGYAIVYDCSLKVESWERVA